MNLLMFLRLAAVLVLSFPAIVFSANSLTIESPMPGDVIKAGTVCNITWSSEGTIQAVDIDLSTDNGATWRPLAVGAENRGSYTCFIPYFTASQSKIRIADAGGTAEDISGTFSFLAGVLSMRTAVIDSFVNPVIHGQEAVVPIWFVNTGEALVLLNSAQLVKSTLPGVDWLAATPSLPAFIRPGDSLAFTVVLNKGGIITTDAELQGKITIVFNGSTEAANIAVTTKVRSSNRAPYFTIAENAEVMESHLLSLPVVAADPDLQIPALSAINLPAGSEFIDNHNGSGSLVWQTDYFDAGYYTVTFVASDGSLTDSANVVIHVSNGNRAPALTLVSHQYITALKTLSFDVSATDPDNDPLTLGAVGMPNNATFVPHGDGTATFTFVPDQSQVGDLQVAFSVSDGTDCANGTVDISVDPAAPMSITACDACSPGSPFGDILTIDPIVVVFSHAIKESSLSGHVSIVSRRDGPLDFTYRPSDRSLTVIPKAAEFSGMDTISIVLKSGIVSWTNEILQADYTDQVRTGPVVYPGDLDNNGVVDERDIMPIGVFFGQSGPSRLRYDAEDYPRPEPAHRWATIGATFADANGSGKVDLDDICYVTQYFGWQRSVGAPDGRQPVDLAAAGAGGLRPSEIRAALSGCPPSVGKQILLEALGGESVVAEETLPKTTELFANYPNPFNPSTTISFQLASPAQVKLTVFNLLGQTVRTLIDEYREAGEGQVEWDGRDETGGNVASGIYLYRLEAGDVNQTRTLLLLK